MDYVRRISWTHIHRGGDRMDRAKGWLGIELGIFGVGVGDTNHSTICTISDDNRCRVHIFQYFHIFTVRVLDTVSF